MDQQIGWLFETHKLNPFGNGKKDPNYRQIDDGVE